VNLPPLRSRMEDVPLLATHFLHRFSEENGLPTRQFSSEAMRPLLNYNWPGNVRELENVVERAVVLSSSNTITADLLPDSVLGETALPMLTEQANASLFEIIEDCERRVIVGMLEKCAWNQTEAAERFRIPLSTLNQKIKRLSIEVRKRGRE
jgi:DNA-binding NtrC family response regulator